MSLVGINIGLVYTGQEKVLRDMYVEEREEKEREREREREKERKRERKKERETKSQTHL